MSILGSIMDKIFHKPAAAAPATPTAPAAQAAPTTAAPVPDVASVAQPVDVFAVLTNGNEVNATTYELANKRPRLNKILILVFILI